MPGIVANGESILTNIPTPDQKDSLDGATPVLNSGNPVTGESYAGYLGGFTALTGTLSASDVNTALSDSGTHTVAITPGATLTMDGSLTVPGGKTLIGPGYNTTITVTTAGGRVNVSSGSRVVNFSFIFDTSRTEHFIYNGGSINLVDIQDIMINTYNYNNTTGKYCVYFSGADYVNINNVHVINSSGSEDGSGFYLVGSQRSRLSNCSVQSQNHGFFIQSDCTLDGCYAEQNTDYGFRLDGGGSEMTVSNCRAYVNGGDGFVTTAGTASVLYCNCVSSSNTGWGFNLGNNTSNAAGIHVSRAIANTAGQFSTGTGWNSSGTW